MTKTLATLLIIPAIVAVSVLMLIWTCFYSIVTRIDDAINEVFERWM